MPTPRLYLAVLLIALTSAFYGCDMPIQTAQNEQTLETPTPAQVVEPEAVAEPLTSPPPTGPTYTEHITQLYEKAKAAGEHVPEDMLEWAKSDMKKIGSFEYKILTFTIESEETILKELNALGGDRWEVYWVEAAPTGKKFYLKKATRSYIQMAGKASAFVPVPGGAE